MVIGATEDDPRIQTGRTLKEVRGTRGSSLVGLTRKSNLKLEIRHIMGGASKRTVTV